MKNGWQKEEVQNLFRVVEEYKAKGKSLLDAFEFHAQKYNRKALSVRNFYYLKVDKFIHNQTLSKQFKINIQLHQKNNFAKFDERQTQKLLEYIKKRTSEGKSVRGACVEIVGNDAKKLVRMQNKYRLEMNRKKMQKMQKNTKNSSKNDFFSEKIPKNQQKSSNNLINFPVEQKLLPQKLTDAEIQSLFLGLVKLVKKSTLSTIEDEIKSEQEKLSVIIRKSAVEINQKNEKIEKLLNENKKLSTQVLSLKHKLEELRTSLI